MPRFSVTRQIDAPVEKVWEVLHDFGDIQRWNPGVVTSQLTSEGPVTEGATRHCTFKPMGAVHERVAHHEENKKMTVHLYETSRLPISEATVHFNLEPKNGGTELDLDYEYTPNLLGKVFASPVRRMLTKGINGLAKSLAVESERIAAA